MLTCLFLIGISQTPTSLGTVVDGFSTYIRAIYHDNQGNHWFGNDQDGVTRYDGKKLVRFTKRDGLAGNQVTAIQQDKRGALYFTTENGISRFDGRTFITLKPTYIDVPDKGWRLHPDDLWFTWGAPEGGPSRYDGKTLYSLRFPKHIIEEKNRPRRLSPFDLYTIYKDRRGHLWFGTADAGLARYDGKTINWLYEDHLTNTPAGGSFGIRTIIEDRDGKLWVCNTKHRYVISPTNLATHGAIRYRAENGTGGDPFYYQSVAKGSDGDLWMMTWRDGVFRWDGKKLHHYPVKDGAKDTLMNQIYKDRQGVLWIASQTAGPYRWNGKGFEKFRLR